MKKRVFLALIAGLLGGSARLFADSAELLPAHVWRFRVVPVYNFAPAAFGGDWDYNEYADGEGASKAYSTGLALEYGIFDWLSLAAQWTPGWVAWSDADVNVGKDIKVNANGVSDLFTGVAVQLVGAKAPIKAESLRFTVAPGLKVPFGGIDALEEYEKWKKGEDITAANPDNHALGAGARVYFDWIPNTPGKHLVFNLFSEIIAYPLTTTVRDYGLTPILSRAGEISNHYLNTTAGQTELGVAYTLQTGGTNYTDPAFLAWAQNYVYSKIDDAAKDLAAQKVAFGTDYTFEAELSYGGVGLGKDKKVIFNSGIPVTLNYNPGAKVGFVENEASYLFKTSPYLSFFFTNWALPTQLQVGYTVPIAGKNATARHILVLQAKLFLKFW
ncbi:MAG: hypothetical protein LBR16_06380 [Treponema sp.]|jgi:hypothetical protein|nr:hypothetical protein [Treponema sp.]